MKKLLLLLPLLLLMSCSNDEPNCDCDRVVATEYSSFNIVGVGTVRGGSFTTINDCTGLQQIWSANQYGFPQRGECK